MTSFNTKRPYRIVKLTKGEKFNYIIEQPYFFGWFWRSVKRWKFRLGYNTIYFFCLSDIEEFVEKEKKSSAKIKREIVCLKN